jgi:hypothetical protein
MEPGGSLPRSQDPETCPYPKPDQSIPRLFSCLLLGLPRGLFALTFHTVTLYTPLPPYMPHVTPISVVRLINEIIFGELSLTQSPPVLRYALPLASKFLTQPRNMQKRSETVCVNLYVSKVRLLVLRMNNFTSDTSPLCSYQQIYRGNPIIRIDWGPDRQKFRIIGFFFENRLQWKFEFRLLLLTICTCV